MTKVAVDDSITLDQKMLDDMTHMARQQITIAGMDDEFHTLYWGVERIVKFVEKAARLYRLLGYDSLVGLLAPAGVTAYQLDSVIRLLSCWDNRRLFWEDPDRGQTKAEELLARLVGVLETHEVMKMDYDGAVYHLDLFPWGLRSSVSEGLSMVEHNGVQYQPVDSRSYNTTRDLLLANRSVIAVNYEEDHATDTGAVGA